MMYFLSVFLLFDGLYLFHKDISTVHFTREIVYLIVYCGITKAMLTCLWSRYKLNDIV